MTGSTLRIVPLALLLVALPLWMIRSDRGAESSFSSSQRLGDNRLTTAAVELTVDRPTTVLTTERLLPGDQQWLELLVTNAGSLPLVMTADAIPEAGFDGLADILEFDLTASDRCGDPTATGSGLAVADVRLGVGETTAVCLVTSMPLSTNNAVQGRTSRFSIVVTGTHDLDE